MIPVDVAFVIVKGGNFCCAWGSGEVPLVQLIVRL